MIAIALMLTVGDVLINETDEFTDERIYLVCLHIEDQELFLDYRKERYVFFAQYEEAIDATKIHFKIDDKEVITLDSVMTRIIDGKEKSMYRISKKQLEKMSGSIRFRIDGDRKLEPQTMEKAGVKAIATALEAIDDE